MRELLSNNSLFVGQLYEDKSLALRARDLIFFTTDLQTVNYYSTIHAMELIYFLNLTLQDEKHLKRKNMSWASIRINIDKVRKTARSGIDIIKHHT